MLAPLLPALMRPMSIVAPMPIVASHAPNTISAGSHYCAFPCPATSSAWGHYCTHPVRDASFCPERARQTPGKWLDHVAFSDCGGSDRVVHPCGPRRLAQSDAELLGFQKPPGAFSNPPLPAYAGRLAENCPETPPPPTQTCGSPMTLLPKHA